MDKVPLSLLVIGTLAIIAAAVTVLWWLSPILFATVLLMLAVGAAIIRFRKEYACLTNWQ